MNIAALTRCQKVPREPLANNLPRRRRWLVRSAGPRATRAPGSSGHPTSSNPKLPINPCDGKEPPPVLGADGEHVAPWPTTAGWPRAWKACASATRSSIRVAGASTDSTTACPLRSGNAALDHSCLGEVSITANSSPDDPHRHDGHAGRWAAGSALTWWSKPFICSIFPGRFAAWQTNGARRSPPPTPRQENRPRHSPLDALARLP